MVDILQMTHSHTFLDRRKNWSWFRYNCYICSQGFNWQVSISSSYGIKHMCYHTSICSKRKGNLRCGANYVQWLYRITSNLKYLIFLSKMTLSANIVRLLKPTTRSSHDLGSASPQGHSRSNPKLNSQLHCGFLHLFNCLCFEYWIIE